MGSVSAIFLGLLMKIWIAAILQIVIPQGYFLIPRKRGCLGNTESAVRMKEGK